VDEVRPAIVPRVGRGLIITDTSRSMENFISGYPGCEFQIRAALADVVGPLKSAFFFDKVCHPLPGNRRPSPKTSFFPALGVLLPGGGYQVLQKSRVELYPLAVQLPAL
jgi:hypothetical protein